MSLTATPTHRLLATTAMLLLVLSAAVSVHAADAAITAGTCKPTTAAAADIGPCIAGSVLTLTGTDIPADATVVIGRNEAEQALIRCVSPTLTATSLTCTIETEKSAVFGEYPITLAGGISAGNIVYGKFPQQSIAGWNTHKLNDRDIVSFYSSDWPSTGDEWLIYGTFDTTKTYKVLFYSDDVLAIADMRTPTCSITTDSVLPYAISCKISVEMGVMGMWGFLVQEGTDGPFIPTSSSVKLIAVNPNLPTATSASGDCAGNSNKCVTGATLTITGTNFNTRDASFNLVSIGTDGKITCTPTKVTATELTCKLTVPSDATVGENAISVRLIVCSHMMKSPSVPLGHLFVGQFPQLTFPGWTKEAHVSGNSLVTSFNSDWPSTGDDWIIYGTFDTTKTYKVLFYSDDPLAIADMRTPTCASITTTANTITCQITIESGVMGMWNFLVREGDDGSCLPGSTSLFKIAVNPKLPTFDVASGACAGESSKCVTGATLTIAGTNFNTRDASYNLVSIGTDGKITCTPKTVTTTALTCELAIPDDAAAGPHAITVRLVVCSHMMKSPSVPLGYMVLGVGSAPGWTPINEHVKISSMAPESVTVGGELSFIGTFETAATYTVSFESVAAASSAVPQCKVTTVTATTVTFKYDGMLGVYGNWRPKLLANGFVLGMAPGTDAQTVTLEPLPPVVEDVSGDCAKDSKKCVTGAQLTFTGKGFNADAKRHRVTIDGMQDGECKVLQGTQQSIVCELTISASKSRASADDVSAYRMSLHTAVTDGNWLPTTAYIGTLMLTTGSDTIPGIVNTDAEPIIIQRITKGGGANKGLIACSVVFAVLLVAVCAGAAFVFWRYKLVKRGAEREHRDEEFWRDNDQQSIGSMPFHAVVKD